MFLKPPCLLTVCPTFTAKDPEIHIEPQLNEQIKNIKAIRNKRKAHRDLKMLMREYDENRSETIHYDEINIAINTIEKILFIFAAVAYRTYIDEVVVMPLKSVGYFIENLEEGNKWRKIRIEKNLKAISDLIESNVFIGKE